MEHLAIAALEDGITSTEGQYGLSMIGTDDAQDIIVGGYGRDTLEGLGGNDTLDGGAGDDTLLGGPGRDTYLLGRDSGFDTLYQIGVPALPSAKADRILLKPGISLDDVTVTRTSKSTIYVRIFDSDAKISARWSEDIAPDEVFLEAADGRVITYGEVGGLPYIDKASRIETQTPGTLLSGTAGADSLFGLRDTIFDSGPGNDYISGPLQSTLIFNRDSGQDMVFHGGMPQPGDVRTVKLGDDVKPEDLIFGWRDNMPYMRIAGTQAEMSGIGPKKQGFSAEPLRLVFADGTVWNNEDITTRAVADPFAKLYLRGSDEADLLTGGDFDDTLSSGSGNDTLIGGRGLDTLEGGNDDDLLQGGEQRDELNGGGGHDVLEGGHGNDELEGDLGDDTLDGGIGSDTLNGGEGKDVYLFGRGSQQDYIAWGDDQDVIRVANGIAPTDVTLDKPLESVVRLSIKGTNDQISFGGPIGGTALKQWSIDHIEFADGTTWNHQDITAMLSRTSDGDDTVMGADMDDVLHGMGGNDKVYGSYGNDTLEGGEGDDTLNGSVGSDTFRFRSGDGSDVIGDAPWAYPEGSPSPDLEHDVLDLLDYLPQDILHITPADEYYNSILIRFNSGDSIKLVSQLPTLSMDFYTEISVNGVSEVRFADGTSWDREELKAHVTYSGTEESEYLRGPYEQSNDLHGMAGDDTLQGGRLADTLDGGTGIDTLRGFDGDDTYIVSGGMDPISHEPLVDHIEEWQDDGIDRVITDALVYQLPTNVENLVMTGKAQGGNERADVMAGAAGARHGIGNVLGNLITGSMDDDVLEGLDGDDVLRGLFGNDTLAGGSGNDTLSGGLGDDLLVCSELTSDNTFEWGRGKGADLLQDAGGQDTLTITPGVSREQLWLRQIDDDLEIRLIGTSDSFTIAQWYAQGSAMHRLEHIQLADGHVLAGAHVQRLVDSMAAFTPPPIGQTSLPSAASDALGSAIATTWA
jgi:Ca2+-binding RTX toxin-like protein